MRTTALAEFKLYVNNIYLHLQAHVIDHQVGEPIPDQIRAVINESARIARAAVQPLDQLVQSEYTGLVFPGGFGAAKNLSDFGFKGTDMNVHKDVERVLKEFAAAGNF